MLRTCDFPQRVAESVLKRFRAEVYLIPLPRGKDYKLTGRKVPAMRSVLVALLAAIVVLFTVPSASAQSNIALGTSTSQLEFLSTGSGNFNLFSCSNVHNGKCTAGPVQGAGTGEGDVTGYNGFYAISNATAVNGTLTNGVNCNVCQWTLSGSMNFVFTSKPNGGGVDLLNGSFALVSMTQTQNKIGSVFNQSLVVNFTVTGGTLKPYFANNPTIELDLAFTTPKSLANDPKGNMRLGWISSGDVSATPEPGTMALLGSGFLLVGGFLRKKFGAKVLG
jgi:PEP-CTERM motif